MADSIEASGVRAEDRATDRSGIRVEDSASGRGSPGQWLFRAEVSGEDGSASLRLLLRRADADRFTLTATDALGQTRWEIRREGTAAIWLDSQRQVFCRLDPALPLKSGLRMPSLALADFPDLLTGEWPPEGDLKSISPAKAEETKRISGEREGDHWASWTLWEDSEPVAWFQRRGEESLLSVRRPSVQLRWRTAARGPLSPSSGDSSGRPRESGREAASSSASLLSGLSLEGVREVGCPENEIP